MLGLDAAVNFFKGFPMGILSVWDCMVLLDAHGEVLSLRTGGEQLESVENDKSLTATLNFNSFYQLIKM